MLRRCTPRNDTEGNNIAFKGLDVVCQYASKFFKTAESGVDKVVSSCEKNPSVHWRYMNFLRQRKTALDAPLYAVSAGRSMIEMLGVLAIIAVLTVGGIAGYSKAMKKYQANKVVGEIIQVLAKYKELIEHDSGFKIYRLDDETRKTLGLCLPSAENCSRYQQRTPVGDIYIHENVVMSDADAELCISAFNNIFIPLKGNIREFTVFTMIKNRDDAYEERKECDKKCKDKCEKDRNCLDECRDKCSEDNSPSAGICISVDKKYCGDWKYLNLYDARVVTEINAACNSGIDKRVEQIRIIFKNGFTSGY